MAINYKDENGVIHSLIPDMNNIDDAAASASTTYSSSKVDSLLNNKQNAEAGKGLSSNDFTDDDKTAILNSPIHSTSTTSPLTDSADGYVQGLTIYGQSEVVDGAIKSAGEGWSTVDLGTLTWEYNATNHLFFTSLVSAPLIASAQGLPCLCSKYRCVYSDTWSGWDNFPNNSISCSCNYSTQTHLNLVIKDTSYTDPAAFKTAMSGVILSYQLADPTQGNAIAVKTDNGTGIDGTMATFATALPLRSTLDGTTRDELIIGNGKAEAITRCEVVDDNIVPLATPVITPLTTAEISAFRGLKTYDSMTNITISDEPNFELDYLKNTENGQAVSNIQKDLQGQIDGLKSKIEKNHFCYSYKIDLSDSNPATCVKPHFDTRYGCDNFSFTSAHMDYANDRFDYGSWEGFIRRIARPCMLKFDGTVDYYLDPDDYSKKITGEASDVADVNYQGNAMVELEKLYFKRYTYNGVQYCFISDRKLDKSFKCWAHHDKYGKELDYIYRACYDGMYDGTRLRSISGVDYHNLNTLTVNKIMSNTTRAEEIAFAQANNVAYEQGEGWYILHKSEWDYINDILFLIGMSTDVQTTFGRGRDSGYVSATNTGIISTGTMDDKGLFWGKNDGSAGVKVLGIENHWANLYKSMAGYINASGTQKIKQTYGTEDGSTVAGFNTDGTGYVTIIGATPTKGDSSASGDGYITAWKYNDYGLIPYECTSAGSSAKFIPDYFYFNNNRTNFALVGGHSYASLSCGLCVPLNYVAGDRGWHVGAALSYKPLSAA